MLGFDTALGRVLWILLIVVVVAILLAWWSRRGRRLGVGRAGEREATPTSGPAIEDAAVASAGAAGPAVVADSHAPAVGAEVVVPAAPQPALDAAAQPAEQAVRHTPSPPVPGPATVPAGTAVAPEDLEIVEGIGPKIAGLLRSAGIGTFAQLAGTDTSVLRGILRQANLRLADPTTWPEQARLAAEGNWEGLKELQANLRGGRQA